MVLSSRRLKVVIVAMLGLAFVVVAEPHDDARLHLEHAHRRGEGSMKLKVMFAFIAGVAVTVGPYYP